MGMHVNVHVIGRAVDILICTSIKNIQAANAKTIYNMSLAIP